MILKSQIQIVIWEHQTPASGFLFLDWGICSGSSSHLDFFPLAQIPFIFHDPPWGPSVPWIFLDSSGPDYTALLLLSLRACVPGFYFGGPYSLWILLQCFNFFFFFLYVSSIFIIDLNSLRMKLNCCGNSHRNADTCQAGNRWYVNTCRIETVEKCWEFKYLPPPCPSFLKAWLSV